MSVQIGPEYPRYTVKWEEEISYDFDRKQVLVECEQFFDNWMLQEDYEVKCQ